MRYVFIMVACLYPAAAWAPELPLSPDEQRSLTAQIQEFGYNCPLAKIAWAKGEDAYGTVIKVFCGPTDREGTYSRAVFRLTFLPNGEISVMPWRD